MTTTARRRNPTCPVSAQHGDISQVWAPLPGQPTASPEAMADDARRRARFYIGSKFWGRSTRSLVLKPKTQRELF
jgi:hypothetical protein